MEWRHPQRMCSPQEANTQGVPCPAKRKKDSTPGEIVPAAVLPAMRKLFQSHAGYFGRWSGRMLLEAGPGKGAGQAGWEGLSQQQSWSQLSSKPDPDTPSSSPPSLSSPPVPAPRFRVARVSSTDAAEGPRASSGHNLGTKTSALKNSNGKNRQAYVCVHRRTPVIRRAPMKATRFAVTGNLGHLL